MPDSNIGRVVGSPDGVVTTLEAVVIRADGSRVDLGVIASSDPERAPLTPRPEGFDGSNSG